MFNRYSDDIYHQKAWTISFLMVYLVASWKLFPGLTLILQYNTFSRLILYNHRLLSTLFRVPNTWLKRYNTVLKQFNNSTYSTIQINSLSLAYTFQQLLLFKKQLSITILQYHYICMHDAIIPMIPLVISTITSELLLYQNYYSNCTVLLLMIPLF